jgi:hypothetical protein
MIRIVPPTEPPERAPIQALDAKVRTGYPDISPSFEELRSDLLRTGLYRPLFEAVEEPATQEFPDSLYLLCT